VLAWVLAMGVDAPQPSRSFASPADLMSVDSSLGRTERFVLPNGMTVILAPDFETPVVGMEMSYQAGIAERGTESTIVTGAPMVRRSPAGTPRAPTPSPPRCPPALSGNVTDRHRTRQDDARQRIASKSPSQIALEMDDLHLPYIYDFADSGDSGRNVRQRSSASMLPGPSKALPLSSPAPESWTDPVAQKGPATMYSSSACG